MVNLAKLTIKQQLIVAAEEYSKMLDKSVVLNSSSFQYKTEYVLRFHKTNFLHLTGVVTNLSPANFFQKCVEATIDIEDFDYNDIKNKNTIKNKLKNLIKIASFFENEIMVQEQFIKNRIICKLVTTNNECTIGFADGKYCLWPKTLLNKNHLDVSKPIFIVRPAIKELI